MKLSFGAIIIHLFFDHSFTFEIEIFRQLLFDLFSLLWKWTFNRLPNYAGNKF